MRKTIQRALKTERTLTRNCIPDNVVGFGIGKKTKKNIEINFFLHRKLNIPLCYWRRRCQIS